MQVGCVQDCVRDYAWFWQFRWYCLILKNGSLFPAVIPKSPKAKERARVSFCLVVRCNIPSKYSSSELFGDFFELPDSSESLGKNKRSHEYYWQQPQPPYNVAFIRWGVPSPTPFLKDLKGPPSNRAFPGWTFSPVKVSTTFIWPLSNCGLCNFDSQRHHFKPKLK